MLSSILSKETCANCRFCCSFRRCSLWETPKIPKKTAKKYPEMCSDLQDFGNYSRMKLQEKYRTNDPNEEVSCLFLNPDYGCILLEEDKPFECKIWPLRIMKKKGEIVVALASSCPSVNKIDMEIIKKMLKDDLLKKIQTEIENKTYLPEEYRDSYTVLLKAFEAK